MKMRLFAIWDSKAEVYSQVMSSPSSGSMIRSFADTVNDGKSDFSRHPADYTLFCVGEYDDQVGVVTPIVHVNLGNGLQYVVSRVAAGDERQLQLVDPGQEGAHA